MFPLVEMKHLSTSINAMGVKAINYGAMKRYELLRLRTAANSLKFLVDLSYCPQFRAKSTITQMLISHFEVVWFLLGSRLAFFRWISGCLAVVKQPSGNCQAVISLSFYHYLRSLELKDFSVLFPLFNLNCRTITSIYIF